MSQESQRCWYLQFTPWSSDSETDSDSVPGGLFATDSTEAEEESYEDKAGKLHGQPDEQSENEEAVGEKNICKQRQRWRCEWLSYWDSIIYKFI